MEAIGRIIVLGVRTSRPNAPAHHEANGVTVSKNMYARTTTCRKKNERVRVDLHSRLLLVDRILYTVHTDIYTQFYTLCTFVVRHPDPLTISEQ